MYRDKVGRELSKEAPVRVLDIGQFIKNIHIPSREQSTSNGDPNQSSCGADSVREESNMNNDTKSCLLEKCSVISNMWMVRFNDVILSNPINLYHAGTN